MTAPLTTTPEMPYVENTTITVSDVLWEKDETGRVSTRVPEYAVHKHKGKIITKDESGVWRYEDGSALKVTGLLISVREDVHP